MEGFFPSSLLMSSPPIGLIPKCGACGLFKTCRNPYMPVTGKGKKGILLIGEAPGETEDDENRQFAGKAGERLRKTLRRFDIDMRDDCWLTNALICRPPKNATPDDNKIDYCRPNLRKTIDDLRPTVIIPLGGVAVQSLLGMVWKDDDVSITKMAGWQIPNYNVTNSWICPTFHPSYIERLESDRRPEYPVAEMMFERHLKAAVKITERPWKKDPDYEGKVELLFEDDKACEAIDAMWEDDSLLAFDYETNMLKPDSQESQIVSCSISNGIRTIAYPFRGNAKKATRNMIRSRNPKVASNIKFEERWSRTFFGHGVTNWYWDTMISAHHLDFRAGISSIKFQSYVRLGAQAYDEHIRPWLKGQGEQGINRIIEEVDMRQLLLYNGLDSLLEFYVAVAQMDECAYHVPRLAERYNK